MRWDFNVRHYSNDAQQQRDFKYDRKHGGVLYPRAATLGGCTAHTGAGVAETAMSTDSDTHSCELQRTTEMAWHSPQKSRSPARRNSSTPPAMRCSSRRGLGWASASPRHLRQRPATHGLQLAGRPSADGEYPVALQLRREARAAQPAGHLIRHVAPARELVGRARVMKQPASRSQHPGQVIVENL